MSTFRTVLKSVIGGTTLSTAIFLSSCHSATATTPTKGDLVFELAQLKLPQNAQVQLIHGVAVKLRLRDWPTIILAEMYDSDAPECTSSMIGPGVLILAAHCLTGIHHVWLSANGVAVPVHCASTSAHEDIALCHVDLTAIQPSIPGLQYEKIDTHAVGGMTPVLMMGFGCADLDEAIRGDVLRVGDATIATPSSAGTPYAKIVADATHPALCPGDSGGPLLTGATTQLQTLPRRIRGVNSSVIVTGPTLTSSVSMLSDANFAPWAKSWLAHYPGAYICGLDPVPAVNACRL